MTDFNILKIFIIYSVIENEILSNYVVFNMKTESYINKIIVETGLTRKEINDRMEEKKRELKGMVSEEEALFILAKELCMDVKDEKKELLKNIEINISEITHNMKIEVYTNKIIEETGFPRKKLNDMLEEKKSELVFLFIISVIIIIGVRIYFKFIKK